ncbi:MAG: hypothetical protein ABW072_13780 [Sedimenticola sp.]
MSEEFYTLFQQYALKFGHTFTSFDMGEEEMALAIKLMQEALEGKRGPVRDRDFGFKDVPPGAKI